LTFSPVVADSLRFFFRYMLRLYGHDVEVAAGMYKRLSTSKKFVIKTPPQTQFFAQYLMRAREGSIVNNDIQEKSLICIFCYQLGMKLDGEAGRSPFIPAPRTISPAPSCLPRRAVARCSISSAERNRVPHQCMPRQPSLRQRPPFARSWLGVHRRSLHL
jgi:hypothetical protein